MLSAKKKITLAVNQNELSQTSPYVCRPITVLIFRESIVFTPEKSHFHKTEKVKRLLIKKDLKVIQYQSQVADNTFITSDGTSLYHSTRKWVVKRHYREDNN